MEDGRRVKGMGDLGCGDRGWNMGAFERKKEIKKQWEMFDN